MFERYTESAKRSIFYARASAILNKAPKIDTMHLLCSLMWPDTSRAQILFSLREKLPQYCKFPRGAVLRSTIGRANLLLTDDGKRILAWAAMEADAMGDAWVDTDHLLLGILRESECQAAQQLTAAGFTLENARALVVKNRPSRPDYGPVFPLGTSPSTLIWLTSRWRWWKARRSEKQFAQTQRRKK